MTNKLYIISLAAFFMSGCHTSQNVQEVEGVLEIGHEVRSFVNVSDNKEYWIIDKSGKLMREYQDAVGTKIVKYQPVYARLKVQDVGKVQDGFGAGYDGAYEVKDIISLSVDK